MTNLAKMSAVGEGRRARSVPRVSLLSIARLCYGDENIRKLNVKLVYRGPRMSEKSS